MKEANRAWGLKYGSTFFALGLLGLLFSEVSAVGGESWMPVERNFHAADQAGDCHVYRGLERRMERELDRYRTLVVAERDLLKSRRAGLEECARERGVRQFKGDEAETLAAELCPEEYQSWLKPGYRITGFQQDLQAERESLQTLALQLRLHCQELPPPEPVRATY